MSAYSFSTRSTPTGPILEACESRLLFSTTVALDGSALNSDQLNAAAAALTDSTQTGTAFLMTEQFSSTWYDAEKDTGTDDDNMCWAAAASNVLQWTGWGDVSGLTTADQDFEYYLSHWSDDGGDMDYGWEWWFDGTNPGQGVSGYAQVEVAGGDFYSSYVYSEYFHSRGQGTTAEKMAMQDIDTYCRAGYGVAIGIYTASGGGHALTVWGFNYDSSVSSSDTSYYTGIWVSDSDDSATTSDGTTAADTMHYYSVTYKNGKYYLNDFYGTSGVWYIGEVEALEMYPGGSDDGGDDSGDDTTVTDDYANAGDWTNAATVSVNSSNSGSATGTLETADDTDLLKFASTVNGTATITLSPSSDLDAVLNVYDSSHTLLYTVDSATAGGAETLTLSVTSGSTYYLEVSSLDGATAGSYSLGLSLTAADDHANASDWDNATTLALNNNSASGSGVIDTASDTDLFQFSASANGTASIKVTPAKTLNTVVNVYSADHTLVSTTNVYGTGRAESVSFTTVAGETYYIEVSSYQSKTAGKYTLSLKLVPDDYANASDWANAASLTLADNAASASGTLELATDSDLFQFTASTTGTAAVQVSPTSKLNALVKIYDANHTLISVVNVYGNGRAESVSFAVTEGSVYYIEVSSYQGRTSGKYSLSAALSDAATVSDDYANIGDLSSASAIAIVSNKGTAKGSLETASDTDLFKVTATSSGTVTVTLTGTSTLDGVLTIYDSTGRLVGTADSYWAGGSEKVSFRVTANTTYYIGVSSYKSQSSGSYTLSVSMQATNVRTRGAIRAATSMLITSNISDWFESVQALPLSLARSYSR